MADLSHLWSTTALRIPGSQSMTPEQAPVSPGGELEHGLIFVAKDPDSVPDGSPALYRTDRKSWIVQGWAVTDPAALAALDLPEGETCVEIPDRLVPYFQTRT